MTACCNISQDTWADIYLGRGCFSQDTYKNWSHSLSCPPFVLVYLEDKFSLAWLLLSVTCYCPSLQVPLLQQGKIIMVNRIN